MKNLIVLCLASVAGLTIHAQLPGPNPYPKTIHVTGSAEMELVPDEIYVSITLKEYQKKGQDKKDLETIKKEFLQDFNEVGIPDSLLSIASYAGANNYYYYRRKKDPNMMASIMYLVKFSNTRLMDALIEKLDDEATQAFHVVATSHSKLHVLRKELKIKAIQAAREKANYLAEYIQEKIGPAITIQEPAEAIPYQPVNLGSNIKIRGMATSQEMYDNASPLPEVDFRKIKLRYEVAVTFALQ